jgi:hypothetical protein
MPRTANPGQNVVEVPEISGSQRLPSADVQIGVLGGTASHPTAMDPPRQRIVEVTRLSGSSGASRRQRSPLHVADAGGDGGVVKAMGSGRTATDGAALGSAGAVVGREAAGGVTSARGSPTDGAGSTGLPHGFAMAAPTNTTSRTTTSAATRRLFAPSVRGVPWKAEPLLTRCGCQPAGEGSTSSP